MHQVTVPWGQPRKSLGSSEAHLVTKNEPNFLSPFMWENLRGQWLNIKVFGITYLVRKIKFKLLFQGPLAKWEKELAFFFLGGGLMRRNDSPFFYWKHGTKLTWNWQIFVQRFRFVAKRHLESNFSASIEAIPTSVFRLVKVVYVQSCVWVCVFPLVTLPKTNIT